MDNIEYNNRVIHSSCPYCSGRLSSFKRREAPGSEYRHCLICGIIWEIINNFACEETKE